MCDLLEKKPQLHRMDNGVFFGVFQKSAKLFRIYFQLLKHSTRLTPHPPPPPAPRIGKLGKKPKAPRKPPVAKHHAAVALGIRTDRAVLRLQT
jgi:hypothetical protein